MKKLLLTSAILATLFIVMGSMHAFKKMNDVRLSSKPDADLPFGGQSSIKYNDCITDADLPTELHGHIQKLYELQLDSSISKIDASIKKFGRSMDATLKNLSTVDAHEYIHQSFEKSKHIIANKDISDLQKYYHLEIMRICYERDKSLNHNAAGML